MALFNVNGASVTIQNLTLQNASTAIGHESAGSLFVTGVTITGSQVGIHPGDSDGDSIVTVRQTDHRRSWLPAGGRRDVVRDTVDLESGHRRHRFQLATLIQSEAGC